MMRAAKQLFRARAGKMLKAGILVSLILVTCLLVGCQAVEDTSTDGILSGILGESSRSESVNIVILLTVLSLLPSILIMLTGFTRIIIVLSLVRNGMGVQSMPPNQVMIGLALFLTIFIMTPVINEINETAYKPYVAEEIGQTEALELAMKPVRNFMLAQTYKKDLTFFMATSQSVAAEEYVIEEYEDIPNTVLIPAFLTSEIKRGFQIGFYIYLPFIVVDMIVASTLMSMGMMMLPPATISLPFKLLLFVLVDGWSLTVQTLLASFNLG